jgi:hypothetical protein
MNIPERYYIVQYPKVGRKYHVSWQSKKSMSWTLKSFYLDSALLETNSVKQLVVKIDDLRETHKQATEKYLTSKTT